MEIKRLLFLMQVLVWDQTLQLWIHGGWSLWVIVNPLKAWLNFATGHSRFHSSQENGNGWLDNSSNRFGSRRSWRSCFPAPRRGCGKGKDSTWERFLSFYNGVNFLHHKALSSRFLHQPFVHMESTSRVLYILLSLFVTWTKIIQSSRSLFVWLCEQKEFTVVQLLSETTHAR